MFFVLILLTSGNEGLVILQAAALHDMQHFERLGCALLQELVYFC